MTTSNDTTIPYGYCQCGCGQKTGIARRTKSREGRFKGTPAQYVKGHNPKIIEPPIEQKFWARVAFTANPDACWEWQSTLNPAGYGLINLGGEKRKNFLAHRVAYTLTYGDILDNLHVCHHCDNPKCCNPTHLFLGTDADNVADKLRKDRQPRGEAIHVHKLTEAQVIYVRKQCELGIVSQAQLARELGVSPGTISMIKKRKVWTHI